MQPGAGAWRQPGGARVGVAASGGAQTTPTRDKAGRGSLRSPAERVAAAPGRGAASPGRAAPAAGAVAALAAAAAPRSLLAGSPLRTKASRCPRTPPSRPSRDERTPRRRPRRSPPGTAASPRAGGGGLAGFSALLRSSLAASPPPPPPPEPNCPDLARLRVSSPARSPGKRRRSGRRPSETEGSDDDVCLPEGRPPWAWSPRRQTRSALDRFLAFESPEPGTPPRPSFETLGSPPAPDATPRGAGAPRAPQFETPPSRTRQGKHAPRGRGGAAAPRPRSRPPPSFDSGSAGSPRDSPGAAAQLAMPSLLEGGPNRDGPRPKAADPVAAALHRSGADAATLRFTSDIKSASAGTGHTILKPTARRAPPRDLFS